MFRIHYLLTISVTILIFACSTNRNPISTKPEVFEPNYRLADYQFVRNRFFFVDEFYAADFENSLDTSRMALQLNPSNFLRQLDVWKSTLRFPPLDESIVAIAGVQPETLTQASESIPGEIEKSRFRRLIEGEDYKVNYERGYFWSINQIIFPDIIAVAFKTDTRKVGMLHQEIDSVITDTSYALLKLIKPEGPPNPQYPTWDLTMQNVYNLGGTDISGKTLDVRIFLSVTGEDKQVDDNSNKTYNFLIGLDRLNEFNEVGSGDGKIDLNLDYIFDLKNGYLVFPSRTPFNPGNKFNFNPEYHVDIYQTTDYTLQRMESKFEIGIRLD